MNMRAHNRYLSLTGFIGVMLAGFLCLVSSPSVAQASSLSNAPPSILARVVDIQDFPGATEYLAYLANRLTLGLFNPASFVSSRKAKMHPTATDADIISFCTCPAVNNPSPPTPNGPQNISARDCNYSGAGSSVGVRILTIVVGTIQNLMNGVTQQFYQRLVANGRLADIFNAALALYLTVYGIMIATGMMSVQSGEVMNRLIKIAVVWALINPNGGAWNLFSDVFGNFFQAGVMDMVRFFSSVSLGQPYVPAGTNAPLTPLLGFLNLPFNLIFSMKFMVMLASIPFVGPFGIVMFIVLLTGVIMFFWMVIAALLTFLKGIIGLYIMLGLAPIFISFFLFQRTREMFNAWINQLITFFLQPILVFAFLGFFILMMSSSLHRIVDKTEYCYVSFAKMFGNVWSVMWYRPAVMYDSSTFDAQFNRDMSQGAGQVSAATSSGTMTPTQRDQAVFDLIIEDRISDQVAYGLIRNRTINAAVACRASAPSPIMDTSRTPPVQRTDVITGQPLFEYLKLNRNMVNDALRAAGQPICPDTPPALAGAPATTAPSGSGSGNFLYAYRGSWSYHGPTEDFVKATGRYPKTGKQGNDFPVDPNDVFFFMLIVFLGWRYSTLVATIASTLGDGISNAMTGDDVRQWFNSKLGVSYVGKGINKRMDSAYERSSSFLTSLASIGIGKAAPNVSIVRPDLVNPHSPKGSSTNPAGAGAAGQNPDPTAARGNFANQVPMGPSTLDDAKINDDVYWNTVNSRAKKTLEEIKGQASLVDPGQHRKLSQEQQDLISRIDAENMSNEKLERILKAQNMKLESKTKEFVRTSDIKGSGADADAWANDTAQDLLNDAAIIQQIEKKLNK